MASASGCRLVTEDGEELLDFLNNYTQSVLGHAPPAVVEAVTDRFALGKCVGGGLPVGAFGGRADIMSVFDPERGGVAHSGTFNANPATMAGGVATLDALDRAAIERLNDLGDQLRSGVREVVAGHERSIRVTGEGSMFQLHVTDGSVTDARSGNPGRDAFGDLFMALRNRGIFIAPRGMGNLSTPMSEREVDEFLDALDTSLAFLA